jgi:hypothetical protein
MEWDDMKYRDWLWNDINNLLAMLRGRTGNEAVEYYQYFYNKYDNDTPAILLKEQIDIVQAHLNRASND